MISKLIYSVLPALLFTCAVTAQNKPNIKFGKVESKDFDLAAYSFDPQAEAVTILDEGSTEFKLNTREEFALQYKRFKRVKIINKNGYATASVEIPLYVAGTELEKIDYFKAATYNLENGKVKEIKLDKSDLFTEKRGKHWQIKKFTFPAIQEGSIIEYSYTISSDFIKNLQPWQFQDQYPCLWSEYAIYVPEFFKYAMISQGYQNFVVKKIDQTTQTFTFTESTANNRPVGLNSPDKMIQRDIKNNLTGNLYVNTWAMKDIPGLKPESFTTSWMNFVARIEFQLSEVRFPGQQPITYITDWINAGKKLAEDEDFGAPLYRQNNWLDDDMRMIVGNARSELEKIQRIVTYMKKNFTSTGEDIYRSDNVRTIYKNKKGNVADLNLLLVSMLAHEKINAEPIIISTRSNGYANKVYPQLDRFNYVICCAKVNDQRYFLDVTDPSLGSLYLPLECYNGHARLLTRETAEAIEMSADSVREKTNTSVFVIADENNNILGTKQQTPGYYTSCELREKIKEKGESEYLNDCKGKFGNDVAISNLKIDSLHLVENELGIKYDFTIKTAALDVLYINPLFGEEIKNNPFKSAVRTYPVEMPYLKDETYSLQMEIPQGFVVDELPKSVIFKLNEQDDGIFEYRISASGGSISLRYKLRFNRAFYAPEEYETLREFYGMMVAKCNEQIVFKKKK